jgi:hypothetical protein
LTPAAPAPTLRLSRYSPPAAPDGSVETYEWREGEVIVGSGAAVNVPLTVGAHVLTLTVADNKGATGSDTVVVTVEAAPVPPDTVTITKATYTARRSQLAWKR